MNEKKMNDINTIGTYYKNLEYNMIGCTAH